MTELIAIISSDDDAFFTELLFANEAVSVSSSPAGNHQIRLTALFNDTARIQLPFDYTLHKYESDWVQSEDVDLGETTIKCPSIVFGNGKHPTTTLCLDALQNVQDATHILDVGTGSGILAISAAKQFPTSHILAIDNDQNAINTLTQNISSLGISHISAQQRDIITDSFPNQFDLILMNVPIQVIELALPHIPRYLSDNGTLILSGFSTQTCADVESILNELALVEIDAKFQENWGVKVLKNQKNTST